MIQQGHKYKLGTKSVIALEYADKGHVRVAEIGSPWMGCEGLLNLGKPELVRVDLLKPQGMKYFGGAYE